SDELVRHIVQDWRGARKHIVRIYNPIAVDRAEPVANEKTLAARPPTVIALGRLVSQKVTHGTLMQPRAALCCRRRMKPSATLSLRRSGREFRWCRRRAAAPQRFLMPGCSERLFRSVIRLL